MKKRVNKPKGTCRVSKWPALALLLLLNGFTVPGYCLDQNPSGNKPVQKAQAIWLATGNLNTARHGHTATLLPNGKVLAVGGSTNSGDRLDSAELYDPATGTWSVTGHLNAGRAGHTATLLPNGQVLVVGGVDNDIGGAELYDPSTGTWTRAGPPTENRFDHTATLLQTGKVLIAGGSGSTAELYDPATDTWSRTGRLLTPRLLHQATLLRDGRVLVTGGANDADLVFPLSVAELYDSVTGKWSAASNLIAPHDLHSATLLANGNVLVAGGFGSSSKNPPGCAQAPVGGTCVISDVPTTAAELFDPATGRWSNTGSLNVPRVAHTATLLPDGAVLIVGGSNLKSTELYDMASGVWASASDLYTARSGHTATLLPNGKVLVVGGVNAGGVLNSAELYQQPSNNSFRMIAAFSDQAGFFQYLQLQELSGLDNQNNFSGLTLEVRSRHGTVKSFTFPIDLPSAATARRPALIGTAHNGLPETDFALPPQFLPTDGGTLIFAGVDVWDYASLPANGYTVLFRGGGLSGNAAWIAGYVFRPFTGFSTGLIAINDPVIEYYNPSLDHYFITMSQPDIDALDSGRFSGWKRTGEVFNAWTAKSELGGDFASTPPNMGPVCRLYIPPIDGDSHFFSASPAECSDAQSQHPEFVLETSLAFYASIPDNQTGECLYDQTPVYRLWNARVDSNHRYTTSTATRDLMVSRGYIAEGYGPNAVAMCVNGGIPGSGN